MTKEITKSIILQEIQDKLKLREFEAGKFLFDETVVPTYDIGEHLRQRWTKYYQTSITSIGPHTFFNVPNNEKWRLSRYDIVFMSGSYTVAGLYVNRRNRSPGDSFIYLDLEAAQAISYHTELQVPVILDSGDQLLINIDGYTSTGNLRLYIDYEMEEIR